MGDSCPAIDMGFRTAAIQDVVLTGLRARQGASRTRPLMGRSSVLSYVFGGGLGVLGESELCLRCWGGICEVVHRGFSRSTTGGEVVHCRRCHGWLVRHFVHCRLGSCPKCQATVVLLIHACGLCVGRGGFHRGLGQCGVWESDWIMMVAKTWRSQVIRLVLGLDLGLFRLDMFNVMLNRLDMFNVMLNSLDRL